MIHLRLNEYILAIHLLRHHCIGVWHLRLAHLLLLESRSLLNVLDCPNGRAHYIQRLTIPVIKRTLIIDRSRSWIHIFKRVCSLRFNIRVPEERLNLLVVPNATFISLPLKCIHISIEVVWLR